MVVLVAISTSVTAMGLLARYRPSGLQAAAAPRTRRPGRCARGVPEGRPCGPTAQELQAGTLVLLDRAFERQRVLRRDPPPPPCVRPPPRTRPLEWRRKPGSSSNSSLA